MKINAILSYESELSPRYARSFLESGVNLTVILSVSYLCLTVPFSYLLYIVLLVIMELALQTTLESKEIVNSRCNRTSASS